MVVPVMFFAASLIRNATLAANIFHIHQPLQRRAARDLGALIVAHAGGHFGIHEAGRHGIDRHAQPPHFRARLRVKPSIEALVAP